jgi:predicted dithiol-disulfide oxidoreductase (DUF899 family)
VLVSLPEIVSPQDWIEARKLLLAQEKDLLKRQDALNSARRRLPMVAIEKSYRFEGPSGEVGLADLFQGRRQLVLQHFMFGPDWDTGCSGCTAGVDEVAPGLLAHLGSRDTSFALVSRAPLEKLEAYKAKRGWQLDWYSSLDSDFNYDFHATLDPAVAPLLYNYYTDAELEGTKHAWVLDPANHPIETPGISFFLREGERVFHTYSTFGRGTEAMGGAYAILDLTVLGRQEDWEEPKGRVANPHGPDPSFG